VKFIWIEILKFIRKNILKIMIGTIIFTLVFVWSNHRSTTVEIDDNVNQTEENNFAVDSEPAIFRFFVENNDGDAFTNNLLIEQYITRSTVLEMASNASDTNLKELIEETGNKAIVDYNESGETKIIGVARDGNSHLLEFYVNVGNETDNLNIANFYYDYISEDNIPFIANKSKFVFHDPRIKELSDDIIFESSDLDDSASSNIIKDIVIGLIVGGAITSGILILLTFMSKKLIYSFSYSLREDDYFFLVDNKLDYKEELKQIIANPTETNNVIIQEDGLPLDNKYLNEIVARSVNSQIINKFGSFLDVSKPDNVDRIVYIIQENRTSRNWYNKQRRLEKTYEIPTVIIQVNEN